MITNGESIAAVKEWQSLTPEQLRAQLPAIGDRLMRRPETGPAPGMGLIKVEPLPCVVTYVHAEHLWYEVEFTTATGNTFRECYKLPDNTYNAAINV